MAKFTNHAKNRLKARFNLNEADINTLGNRFNQRKFYHVIGQSDFREIRETEYNGAKIQAVIVAGVIKTCIPDTFIPSDMIADADKKELKIIELKKTVARLNKIVKKSDKTMKLLGTGPILDVIKYIINLRRNWKDTSPEQEETYCE